MSLLNYFAKVTPDSKGKDKKKTEPPLRARNKNSPQSDQHIPSSSQDDMDVIKEKPVVNDPDSDDEMKGPKIKRRRVTLSSDEEDESYVPEPSPDSSESDIDVDEAVNSSTGSIDLDAIKKTPASRRKKAAARTPQSAASTLRLTPKTASSSKSRVIETPKSINAKSKSFLASFACSEEASTTIEAGTEGRFRHLTFDFLRPDRVRDAERRSPDSPDYDPRTLYVPEQFLREQTPGHKQWWKFKSQHYDAVLFFKVGKFYELYHMDAVVGVKELNLNYMKGEFAHSGFPEIAYEKFAEILVNKGYNVARIEQTETPQQLEERMKNSSAKTKEKVVKRELCRITTPGTQVFAAASDASTTATSLPNYLLAVKDDLKGSFGVCIVDTAVGIVELCQFTDDGQGSRMRTLLAHYPPKQILLERGHQSPLLTSMMKSTFSATPRDLLTTKTQFLTSDETLKILTQAGYYKDAGLPDAIKSMQSGDDALGLTAIPSKVLAISAFGAAIWYMRECLIDMAVLSTGRVAEIVPVDVLSEQRDLPRGGFDLPRHMVLDDVTLQNLDVVSVGGNPSALDGSLFHRVDFCSSAAGKRLLRQWLCTPLCDPASAINERLDAVEALLTEPASLDDATVVMKRLPDLERILQRNSSLLQSCLATEQDGGTFPDIAKELERFEQAFDHGKAVKDGVIVPGEGIDPVYDKCNAELQSAIDALDDYLLSVRKEWKSSRITYVGSAKNRYQLEFPEEIAKALPDDFEFKSQRKGFKRFTTQESVELFATLQAAEESREASLKDTMSRIFGAFDEQRHLWKRAAENLATVDALMSFAHYARSVADGVVCRPKVELSDRPFIAISGGAHPCSDRIYTNGNFIPNDTYIGTKSPDDKTWSSDGPFVLLTGPNMGGKSTLMRQVSLLVVLAQAGCFVPALECRLTPVDRLFTRLGARDSIVSGQSTFFVEMLECSSILRHTSRHSLILMDELGRGTSTHDGTAIAAAVVDHLTQSDVRPRTLFSTHYHTLVDMMGQREGVALGHMACMVENENVDDPVEENVTFLYKLTEGACPKSYGFHAAKLAGLPIQVIKEAYLKSVAFERDVNNLRIFRKVREACGEDAKVVDARSLISQMVI